MYRPFNRTVQDADPKQLSRGLTILRNKVRNVKSPGATKVVFRAITNSYDQTTTSEFKETGVDHILFHDGSVSIPEGWESIVIPFFYRSHQRTAKVIKIVPHRFLDCYAESIWIDGNRRVRGSLWDLLDDTVSNIALLRHPERTSVREECEACWRWGKADKCTLNHQLSTYTAMGFPDTIGLFFGGFIYRQHNDPNVVSIMESWWDEIEKHTARDQISLPFCMWKHNAAPTIIDRDATDNESFRRAHHVHTYCDETPFVGRVMAQVSWCWAKFAWIKRVGQWFSKRAKNDVSAE